MAIADANTRTDKKRCFPKQEAPDLVGMQATQNQEVVEMILPRSRKSGSSSLGMASSAALVKMSACFTKKADSLAYAVESALLPL
jgi:hypothetical protein